MWTFSRILICYLIAFYCVLQTQSIPKLLNRRHICKTKFVKRMKVGGTLQNRTCTDRTHYIKTTHCHSRSPSARRMRIGYDKRSGFTPYTATLRLSCPNQTIFHYDISIEHILSLWRIYKLVNWVTIGSRHICHPINVNPIHWSMLAYCLLDR